MSPDKQATDHADPKLPHAFVGKFNVPFAAARPFGAGGVNPIEVPVRRLQAPPDCAVCGKPTTDKIHEAANEAAEAEELHWPE